MEKIKVQVKTENFFEKLKERPDLIKMMKNQCGIEKIYVNGEEI